MTEKSESQKFDAAMKKILSVSKEELQRRIEADKQAKASASHGPAASH
jgi:hypothetical protein